MHQANEEATLKEALETNKTMARFFAKCSPRKNMEREKRETRSAALQLQMRPRKVLKQIYLLFFFGSGDPLKMLERTMQ